MPTPNNGGRLLRYVWLHQGSTWTLVNLELVRLGFASAIEVTVASWTRVA